MLFSRIVRSFQPGETTNGYLLFFLGLSLTVASYDFLIQGTETIGLLLLLIAVIAVAYSSAVSLRGGITESEITPSRWYRLGLVIILVIATCNCFYQLEYTPYHLSGWEVGGGISALHVSHRVDPDYHRYLWSSLDRPFKGVALCPFFVYFLWGLFKIFGVSLLMLRSAGVFSGKSSLRVNPVTQASPSRPTARPRAKSISLPPR